MAMMRIAEDEDYHKAEIGLHNPVTVGPAPSLGGINPDLQLQRQSLLLGDRPDEIDDLPAKKGLTLCAITLSGFSDLPAPPQAQLLLHNLD